MNTERLGPTERPGAAAPAGASARRCHLTVLFCDLSGSTELGAELEAEQYAELLGQLRGASAAIVARHGGTVVRVQGDGMLAIFGHPQAQEDDGRRAAEAALDIHDLVRQLRPGFLPPRLAPLAMHSGVHAGVVLVEEGGIETGRFELLGNVPNVAARLCSAAARDQILVSEESLGPQAAFFVTGPSQWMQPRGAARPLAVVQVRGRSATPHGFAARAQRGTAPFVGRHQELQTLHQRLAAARDGTPALVAVSGGPGVGKSRLLQEFLAQASQQGWQVHRGWCESYLGAEPLQPFLQVLRALFGLGHGQAAAAASAQVARALDALDPLLALLRDEFLQMLSLPLPESAAPAAGGPRSAASATSALHDLLDLLAARTPLVLFVDDWQWADDASRQVLSALLGLRRPVLLVLALRAPIDDDLVRRRATLLELAPLDAALAAQAVHCLLPGTSPLLAAEIHRYSGGNPLFIEELCHLALAEGPARFFEGRQHSAAWLNALVESRLARLPLAQAHIVRSAAVLGHVFPAWLLQQVTGLAPNDPVVAALAEQDFIFPADQDGMLRFKHGITRDAIYGAVGLHQRRELHLAVAQALRAAQADGGDEALEALAYHCAAGGDAPAAARYAEAAGDKAMASSALDRARVQYLAALEALDLVMRDDPGARQRWVAVVQKLGLVCVFDPLGVAQSIALFTQGVALAQALGEPNTLARAEYWMAYVCYSKGRARDAVQHARQALALATQVGDERLAAQVSATLGQALTSAADYDQALPLLEGALATKRAQVRGSANRVAVGSAFSLSCKGLILGDRGDFAAAHACMDEALALIAGSSHQVESSVRGWKCTVLQWQGRWAEGLREAELAVQVGEHVKSSHLLAISRALWGYCLWMHSGDPQGIAVIEEATHWMDQRQGRLFSSLNHGWLADGLVAQGRLDQVRVHVARALRRGRALDRIGEALACRAMVRAAVRQGHSGPAERYLALARRSAAARGAPHEQAANALCEAELRAAQQRPGDAARALDCACEGFTRLGMHWHLDQAQALRKRWD